MLVFWIVLGIIVYIIIGIITFIIFSRINLFNEYTSDFKYMDFPINTFWCSIFWIIAFPLLLIKAVCDWIKDEVELIGYMIYKNGKKKKKE